jgi:hypothetical protein
MLEMSSWIVFSSRKCSFKQSLARAKPDFYPRLLTNYDPTTNAKPKPSFRRGGFDLRLADL